MCEQITLQEALLNSTIPIQKFVHNEQDYKTGIKIKPLKHMELGMNLKFDKANMTFRLALKTFLWVNNALYLFNRIHNPHEFKMVVAES